MSAPNPVDTGISLGAALAVVCSWQRNRSLMWAILHGILSWLYVIYFALTRRPEERARVRLAGSESRRSGSR